MSIPSSSGYPQSLDLDTSYENQLDRLGFTSGEIIGQGSYGRVVRSSINPKKVVKLQSPRNRPIGQQQKYCESAEKELNYLAKLSKERAPHIVRQVASFFTLGKRYASVQDYAGKDLYALYLNDKAAKKTSLDDLERIAKQLLESFGFIHQSSTTRRRCAHFDVKPQNVLEDPEGQVSLTDFGLSEGLDSHPYMQKKFTFPYRPPETTLYNFCHTSSDIWALGCTLFELATGELFTPVQRNDPHAELKMLYSYLDRLQIHPSQLNHEMLKKQNPGFYEGDSLKQCERTSLDPFNQVIESRYGKNDRVTQFIDLLQHMFEFNLSYRGTASELLKHPFFTSNLSSDIAFSLKCMGKKGLGMRICAQGGSILLTTDLSNPLPCYHIPKRDYYILEYFDLSDPEKKTIYKESLLISDRDSVFINADAVFSNAQKTTLQGEEEEVFPPLFEDSH